MDEWAKLPQRGDDENDDNDDNEDRTSRMLYLGDFASAITVKRAIIPLFWLASIAVFNTLYVASHLVIRGDDNDNDNDNDFPYAFIRITSYGSVRRVR